MTLDVKLNLNITGNGSYNYLPTAHGPRKRGPESKRLIKCSQLRDAIIKLVNQVDSELATSATDYRYSRFLTKPGIGTL